MDHASIIVRDGLEIGRLEARRYADRVRHDVAPRAALRAAAAFTAGLAGLFGLLAIFIAIANALDSVAWAFLIYCVAFAVAAFVIASVAAARSRRVDGDAIARRFPAARMRPDEPEHGLVLQRETPEGHRRTIEEARRESARS